MWSWPSIVSVGPIVRSAGCLERIRLTSACCWRQFKDLPLAMDINRLVVARDPGAVRAATLRSGVALALPQPWERLDETREETGNVSAWGAMRGRLAATSDIPCPQATPEQGVTTCPTRITEPSGLAMAPKCGHRPYQPHRCGTA